VAQNYHTDNQVDITDGLNARDGESTFNSDHEAKTSPIYQSTKKT